MTIETPSTQMPEGDYCVIVEENDGALGSPVATITSWGNTPGADSARFNTNNPWLPITGVDRTFIFEQRGQKMPCKLILTIDAAEVELTFGNSTPSVTHNLGAAETLTKIEQVVHF